MTEKTFLLTVNTELALIPRGEPARRTLEITLYPPKVEQVRPRPRLNLALVLDRSGSMSGDKLRYVKEAAAYLVNQLQEQDRAAVVVYDDQVSVVEKSCPVTPENRRSILRQIAEIRTGGSTNLGDGWATGCQEAAQYTAEEALARTLLLTDGLANVGITDLEELALRARNMAGMGVSTSTFGVGQDYNEHLLEAMASAGGGNYYFIDSPQKIPQIFAEEFAGLAAVSLRDVELTLKLPAGVSARVLGSWGAHSKPDQLRIVVGALQAGKPQPLYVELDFAPAPGGNRAAIQCQLLGCGEGSRVGELVDETVGLIFEAADPAAVDSAPRDLALLGRAALVRLGDAANEAHKLERRDEREKAYALLSQAIRECRPYLSSEEIERYQELADRLRHGMDDYERKSRHHANYLLRKSRL